jgi:hypothetical protein
MPKKRNYLDEYLSEIISYGGIPYTRGAVIAEMQSEGIEQVCIDRWLQGQEFAARLEARRQQAEEDSLRAQRIP